MSWAEVAHGKGGDVEDTSVNCMNGPASEPLHLFEVIIGHVVGFQGHVCVRMFAGDRNSKQRSSLLRDKQARPDGNRKANARKGGKPPDQKLNGLIVLRAMNWECNQQLQNPRFPSLRFLCLQKPLVTYQKTAFSRKTQGWEHWPLFWGVPLLRWTS